MLEKEVWNPDVHRYKHCRTHVVHLLAGGTTSETFSCGLTSDHITIDSSRFLDFRKCKRCAAAKPIKDVGALASALKKQRIEVRWIKVEWLALLGTQLKMLIIFHAHSVYLLHPQPLFRFNLTMGTSLEWVNALKSSALEVALMPAEASALETNGITSLARLAFAACHTGQTPTEAQLEPLLHPILLNPGNTASLKILIFESQTLVCNEVKVKANRKDDASTTFAGAERDDRIEQQKLRLTGLRFKGEEECCHSSYDITLNMLEKNCLLYLGPEKFPTRRHELPQKKPSKEISIDQAQLVCLPAKLVELTQLSTLGEAECANGRVSLHDKLPWRLLGQTLKLCEWVHWKPQARSQLGMWDLTACL